MFSITSFINTLKRRWMLSFSIAAVCVGGYYFIFLSSSEQVAVDTYAVVESVARGTVSSGVKTSGTVMAAQKLDLDVYKQARRIEAVNVSNANRVEAGTVLFSFDKSEAYVAVESSRVDMTEAELSLATVKDNSTDENTRLRTLQSTRSSLRADIVEAEKDLLQAQRDFFNMSRTAEPGNTGTEDKTRPTLSGVYNGIREGSYRVEVYSSSADSGYSYKVSGLEQGTESVLPAIPTPVGTQGLKILFPTDLKHGDVWIIHLPNILVAEYQENKENYTSTVRDLQVLVASKKTELANTELEIKNEAQTDTTSYRNLGVAKAEATFAKARQALSENYDVVQEQDIVAPFAGTVEGLENVVVGATPTGDTNDTISLGTLISDEFIVTFSLGAVDVAKVFSGQSVLVSITSFPGVLPLSGKITEISSLPESDGVATYEVQARIENTASSTVKLREGLLADIEVVQEEVNDVLRVPLSAISYDNGDPRVALIGELTPAQEESLKTLGVVKSVNGMFPSYTVPVTLGVVGSFYAEVTSGLTEGQRIMVTETKADTAVVEQDSFGPPRDSEGGEARAED
jgi:multidrug efflux pump subunit AcrA (membrane-fusion protein)